MSLALGPHRVDGLYTGPLLLDGGAAFGRIPREAWSRLAAVDSNGTVAFAHRSLVVRTGKRVILVGAGGEPARFDQELARLGLGAGAVTDVILARVTRDHAGALVRGGEPTFPAATVHLQRRQWAWAHHPSDLDETRYSPPLLDALEASGRLHLIEGETELFAGVSVMLSEGHTVGQQLVRVGDTRWLTFAGALVPTSAHLKPAWVSALDLYPLTTVEEKKMLVAETLEEDGMLFFEHDPRVAAGRLREEEGGIAAVPVELS